MPARAQSPKVTITTNLGKIVVELDSAKAPKTVENFLAYVDSKFYDGTIFHRVIDGFMVQGGGFTKDMMQQDDARAGRQRVQERALERARHRRDGAHRRPQQRDLAVLHQLGRQRQRPRRRQGPRRQWGYTVFGKVIEGHGRGRQDLQVKTTTVER